MTKQAARVRIFAPKTRTGCKTCRTRRVKCDEKLNERGECQKCASSGRACSWFDTRQQHSPASTSSSTSSSSREQRVILPKAHYGALKAQAVPEITVFQPPGLGDGLNLEERRAVGFFLCRTSRDLGYTFFSPKWITLSIQIAHQEPALRYAMAAIGSMHRSRRPFTHTSMHPIIESNGHSVALQSYSKAMAHLRDYIDKTSSSDKALSIDVSLLSCILFFCFEQLQSELASACLHMSTGLRLIRELKSSEDSRPKGSLSDEVYDIFSGFDDSSFEILRQHQIARQRRLGLAGHSVPHIPGVFSSAIDANDALDTLESVRARIGRDLIQISDNALKTTNDYPSDLAVVHCIAHTLSRIIDLTAHETLSRDIRDLEKAYTAWNVAFEKSIPFLHGLSPQGIAVLQVQHMAGRLSLIASRSPSEIIWDEFEPQLGRMLDLAEVCLLQEPLSERCNIRDINGKLSGVGHGLAMGTELLSYIYMAGMKSRQPSTRTRAIKLLKCVDNKTTPYHADIWPRFMKRVARYEERLSEDLCPGDLHSPSATTPEGARLSDVVFSQVKYRPRGVNMICTRYIFEAGIPTGIEVIQGMYDIFSDEQISETTFTTPLPEAAYVWKPSASSTDKQHCLPLKEMKTTLRPASKCDTSTGTTGSWPNALAFSWKTGDHYLSWTKEVRHPNILTDMTTEPCLGNLSAS